MSAKSSERQVRTKRETKPKAAVAVLPTSHALKIKIDDLVGG